ncbi:hypothetical protein [Streptomyces sp. NPDC049881]|uniref:type II toxin-antitoxin system RelE family toxin n=1 Tax=Streptomyces sp. NPDC049881 TaxID=3155778 RepID=UPI00342306BB
MYEIKYTDVAEQQRKNLPAKARRAFEAVVDDLRRNPMNGAKKGLHDTWTREFGQAGLIMYMVTEKYVKITVLRVFHT